MDVKELAQLVQDVRSAQNIYFKSRTVQNLEFSKAKERELDNAVKEILNPTVKNQTELF